MKETTLNGQSADIVSDNIQKLKQIFPEVFCEDSIDFEKLQAVLGEYADDNEERYNFTWWGKSRALRLAQTPSMGTLRPCKEESKDWDTTENLYIEGDNLEVLKLLQKSYHGKIKMIYIDPPYNTGKDFVYPDDYKDPLKNYLKMTGQVDEAGKKVSTNSEASGRYHTNWLNMMYPRLRLARNLLRDDGVIFISIDDNEVDNLRKLCNEIFGEENFVAQFVWKSKLGKVGTTSTISSTHEYILCFAKQFTKLSFRMIEKYSEGRKENLRQWGQADRREDRPSMYYPIEIDGVSVLPIKDDGTEGRWRVGKETAEELKSQGCLTLVEKETGYNIYRTFPPGISSIPYDTLLLDDIGTSAKGSITLQSMDLQKYFDYPKSVDILRFFTFLCTYSNDIILDFFSGSATTAHAVINLNAEDGGDRKFIMVQLPEPTDEKSEAYKAGYENICEIGKERIRRAGEKIKAELREKQKGQSSILEENTSVNPDDLDIGFKVFKLDSSNLKKWNPDYENLEASLLDSVENFVEGRTELDVVYEIMLKYGIDLTLPLEEYEIGGKKIFSIGYGALMICLDQEITTEVANQIVRLKEELKPEVMRVVFKDNGFQDDSAKTNTKEILRNAGIEEIVSV